MCRQFDSSQTICPNRCTNMLSDLVIRPSFVSPGDEHVKFICYTCGTNGTNGTNIHAS